MQKKVWEIFNGNVFSIPNYQRDYAWEERNLDDLWEDLLEAEKAENDEMGHFLGTIVVAKIQVIRKCMTLLMDSNEQQHFLCCAMHLISKQKTR